MSLVDQYGNPISPDRLQDEIAGATVASIRSVWHESVANSLTPLRLAEILRGVNEGDITSYLTLAEEMEERDLHYRSVLSTRKLAVSGLNIVVEARTDDARDVKYADFTRGVLHSEEVSDLLPTLLDGLGKGFAVGEIMWDRSGKEWLPIEYKERDQRFFTFDQETGRKLLMFDESDPLGVPLEPYKFVVHYPKLKTGLPIRGGLARIASVAYMVKSFTLKDWMSFCEVFGMPLRLGRYAKGTTADERATLLRAVTNIGVDAAAIVPEDMPIEFIAPPSSTGGDKLFEGFAKFLDNQVSKGILGQTASVEGTPGKLGAEQAQEEVREDIRKSDAKQIAATLRRDIVRPLIDLNFGPQPRGHYPVVRLEVESPEDLVQLSEALPPFIDRGLPVEISVILDKFGLPEPEDNAKILSAKASPLSSAQEENERESTESKPKALSTSQLVALAAQAALNEGDEIDEIVEEAVADWQQIMDPMLNPVLELARTAKNEKEFLIGLEELQLDKTNFIRAIATATFKARSLGNG